MGSGIATLEDTLVFSLNAEYILTMWFHNHTPSHFFKGLKSLKSTQNLQVDTIADLPIHTCQNTGAVTCPSWVNGNMNYGISNICSVKTRKLYTLSILYQYWFINFKPSQKLLFSSCGTGAETALFWSVSSLYITSDHFLERTFIVCCRRTMPTSQGWQRSVSVT